MAVSGFQFDNTYAAQLEGFYVPWQGEAFPAPSIVRVNTAVARDLGLDPAALDSPEGAAILSGKTPPEGATPLAMAYAGHQFGGFSPQLGDGRAILLGEIIDTKGARRDLHLKGSGRTPFSRGGDGKAVLGPVLREYLIGEAMHALGIPTTRALAAVTTGEDVMRDGPKPGAVLARVAASHLRVGTFQFFAARRETEMVRKLADYAIARHYPDLAGTDAPYRGLLERVSEAQAALVARWMGVGFIHGVMNTDNMTISGETIDYGPCAFMDSYAPGTVFSSIDHQGRYAYGNQAVMAQWNLARFAETLVPLISPDDTDRGVSLATEVIDRFPAMYSDAWTAVMRAKLGLVAARDEDTDLARALFEAMEGQGVDFTQFFRGLADGVRGGAGPRGLFEDPAGYDSWHEAYILRQTRETATPEARADAMDRVNPLYIPRNHLVEAALTAAEAGDLGPFNHLLDVLETPFEHREGREDYAAPAPADAAPYVTFCGT